MMSFKPESLITLWIQTFFHKLRSYIPQLYPSGETYIQGETMADLTTWAIEVELFACAQLSGKDVVCYCHRS